MAQMNYSEKDIRATGLSSEPSIVPFSELMEIKVKAGS